jgi:hypothetical protein
MVTSERELDIAVAKKLLGLYVWFDTKRQDWSCFHTSQKNRIVILPKFSTNIDHAYRIVNFLQRSGYFCHVGSTIKDDKIVWRACFFTVLDEQRKELVGSTLPYAICLAALATLK